MKWSLPLTVLVVLLAGRGWAAEAKQKATDEDAAAAKLVQAALESELDGHNAQREALLRRALEQSPDAAAAHWQLGQVRVQGRWQSPAEVVEAARHDPRLTEYVRRRDAAGPTVAAQVALARWCHKNHLDEQSRVHWMWVLQFQADNAEAMQALGLRPYQGILLTQRQIEQFKTQQQRVQKAADRWRPLVTQWRTAAEHHAATVPTAAREKLAAIADPVEMLGLERALWRQVGVKRQTREYHAMLLAMTPLLGENPSPVAAESLVRSAVFSGFKDVRIAAVDALKRHPLDHYVPLLLAGLQSPIEASAQYRLSDGGDLIASYSVFQEGALTNRSALMMLDPVYPDPDLTPVTVAPGTGTVHFDCGPQEKQMLMRIAPGIVPAAYARAKNEVPAAKIEAAQDNAANAVAAAASWQANRQLNAQKSQVQAVEGAAAMRDAVDRANRAIAARNVRIEAALGQTTGLDLGDEPKQWWTWWWQDYNESYRVTSGTDDGDESPSPKPESHYEQYVEYAGSAPTYAPPGSHTVGGPVACSCFAPGTMVWTLTGRRAIEKITIGDRVLAQDVESGEVAYQPVLAVTVRQPGPRMKIRLGDESVIATPSHPFWVLGAGWRMTKQLAVGDRIHTPSGGVAVESIEKLAPDPTSAGMAYNLIVADFQSYFVGQQGLLVHDNTPRRPTAAVVPGLVQR